MQRTLMVWVGILLGGLLAIFLVGRLLDEQTPASAESPKPSPSQFSEVPEVEHAPAQPKQTLGDRLLASYGSEGATVRDDLVLFTRYLSNVFLLVKQRDPRYYATNEDLALFLTGTKGNRTPYLSADWPYLNSEGQLLDRFGSALIVHSVSSEKLEIRSAGPDRIPYTEDDLVLD